VLSDIHANLEAFHAVLRDLDGRADRILNLGDLVGYNASPNECVELARKSEIVSIQGNHDQAACDLRLAGRFNIYAFNAILWTQKTLTKDNIKFLNSLAEKRVLPCGMACHGSPDSAFSYIGLPFQARATLKKMKKGVWCQGNICLFGHTHKQKVWRMDVRGKVSPIEIPNDGVVDLIQDEFYLLNPGSVGQPRNGDPRSSYLIYNTHENKVTFRLVSYNQSETIKKILNAKLPEFFADRLLDGT
jgi:predicted phosphodiesterase